MSIAALAATAGVATKTIVDIEHGRSVPRLATIKALSAALAVDALEIEEFQRATERQYLAALSEACTPDDWAAIVAKAVQDATAGDRYARDWLASFLIGQPDGAAPTLHKLAVEAEAGVDIVAADARLESLLSF